MRHVVVGTAGHIDHGKTALVKALTGIDTDRLKEERLRGITIDLGFAHLELTDLQIGFVDVPGHERFVKNMLAGIGGIDLVLLVVAADESIMPQTREHFEICRLLGIGAGAVVISKVDVVEPEFIELVSEEVREMVRGSFLEGAPIVPVSARTGAGLPELIDAIRQLASSVPERSSALSPRLPIDRAFSIRGFGTVVTGTLTSGQLRKEQEVELIPGGLVCRIRGIQVHGRPSDAAVAGQRTAVNLQGVDLAQLKRGMVLTLPRQFHTSSMLDVELQVLPSAPRALRNLVKVRFHHGTAEVLARVALLGSSSLSPGKSGYAQLRLDSPAFCLHGDSFIIRQFSPAVTIGGGRVLNPLPIKHRSTDRSIATSFHILRSDDISLKIPELLAASGSRVMNLTELKARLGLADRSLAQVCSDLATTGVICLVPGPVPILALTSTIESLAQETLAQIESFHGQNPLSKGISREELRTRVFHGLPAELFRYCLDDLITNKRVSVLEETVSLHGRVVRLSEQGEKVRDMIEALFRRTEYQPIPLSELPAKLPADGDTVREISFWMLKEKILIRLSDDLAYHCHTLDEVKKRIQARFAPGSKFGVAEFKEMFDLTRKHAIPLLEFLDRERFTRRQGNDRILL